MKKYHVVRNEKFSVMSLTEAPWSGEDTPTELVENLHKAQRNLDEAEAAILHHLGYEDPDDWYLG